MSKTKDKTDDVIKISDIKKIDFVYNDWEDLTVCCLCGEKNPCDCYHYSCPCGKNEEDCVSPSCGYPCRICNKNNLDCMCFKK